MKYHVIKTSENDIRILEVGSPSYQLNLDSLIIVAEAYQNKLPDINMIDCWVITDNNVITIDANKLRAKVLRKKLKALAHATDESCSDITSGYSSVEIATWASQATEATAWIADNNAPTPTIDAIYQGDNKLKFSQSVITKAATHKQSLSKIGASKRVRDRLKTMTIDELTAASVTKLLIDEIARSD